MIHYFDPTSSLHYRELQLSNPVNDNGLDFFHIQSRIKLCPSNLAGSQQYDHKFLSHTTIKQSTRAAGRSRWILLCGRSKQSLLSEWPSNLNRYFDCLTIGYAAYLLVHTKSTCLCFSLAPYSLWQYCRDVPLPYDGFYQNRTAFFP